MYYGWYIWRLQINDVFMRITCSSLVLNPRHRNNFFVSRKFRIPSRSWSNNFVKQNKIIFNLFHTSFPLSALSIISLKEPYLPSWSWPSIIFISFNNISSFLSLSISIISLKQPYFLLIFLLWLYAWEERYWKNYH